MNTTPLNNNISNNGNGKKWTRASIAAAVASGALTTEAANLLYAQLTNEFEPTPEPVPEPEPTPDDIVDVIVEEIDPQDIDMEDVLLVDEIGTVYTVDGGELNAALIHDTYGSQAVMVDVDGDNVYDVIATPEGEVIAQVPGDIDVSDVELLYAQQHGHTGYMEQNDFDIAMNEEHNDIQNDISLT